ncbi:hypothetical protein KKH82_08025 [Patescibacteria group bacterium]|nr:hypothetical protein [Patescibacteria group bacterium]
MLQGVRFNTTGPHATLDELLGKDAKETISAKANRMRLHELLGGDASLRNPRKGIPTYDDLMKNQYHLPD